MRYLRYKDLKSTPSETVPFYTIERSEVPCNRLLSREEFEKEKS